MQLPPIDTFQFVPDYCNPLEHVIHAYGYELDGQGRYLGSFHFGPWTTELEKAQWMTGIVERHKAPPMV